MLIFLLDRGTQRRKSMRDLTTSELQTVSGGDRTRVHIVTLPQAATDHASENAHLPGVITPVPGPVPGPVPAQPV